MSGAASVAGQSFPRAVLVAIGLMLAMVIAVSGLARWTGYGTQIPVSTPLAERSLRFEDRDDHGVTVTDASTGRLVSVIQGQAGFLRQTIRGLAQQRKRDSLDETTPFRLTEWADGRLTLDDPVSGRHIELEAFGETNEAVFAALLTDPEGPKP